VTFEHLRSSHVRLIAALPSLGHRPLLVYRNRLALPRARVVPALLPYIGDQGFIETVSGAEPDLFAGTALVASSELAASGIVANPTGPQRHDSARAATILCDRGDELHIQTTGQGGFLVVSDCYVPGWRATVDGHPAPILLADGAFRAVPIPPGSHQVVMHYSWYR
jgi:hypothetical protein